MAWLAGLSRRMWVTAAVSLVVALAALAAAQLAAADARRAGRELSSRLVPAAAEVNALAGELTVQRVALRDYVFSRRSASLAAYEQPTSRAPGRMARLAELLAGDARLPGRLAAVRATYRAWVDGYAVPELDAAGRGAWTAAQRIQLSDGYRQQVLALLARVGDLQDGITVGQITVSGRLRQAQSRLLTALVGTVVLVVLMACGGVVAVRRWLLRPFTALRQATDAVAGGAHDTRVPAVGPTELADLGRSVETMRTRLLAAERRFRDLLEASPDATVQVAADGSIVLVNAQAERLFGYRRAELVGRPVEMLVPAAVRDAHPRHRADYLATPAFRPMGGRLALSAVHRDGHEFPVEVSLGPSTTADEGVIVSAAVRDITDRLAAQAERERLIAEAEAVRSERRLAQSQRLESLGQLVGGVAHDFNNLLNIILGYTGFIAEQVADSSAADDRLRHILEDVDQVRGAAERAARLTHQLLAFGRREITKPEVLNLNDVVAGLEPLLRQTLGEHIDLITGLDPELWSVKADPGHLEQVLVNLAVNARDAMPNGGKLSIDTENTDVDHLYASAHPGLQPGLYARLRIADTGCGMSRDTLARVFEPFFTTKPQGQGTGLGLATVYGIITQAGGHAQIYSEPGLGTTFTALLPATDEAPTRTRQPESAASSARGETILLVEDEESLRSMVARILAAHGYEVLVATTATDALDQTGDLDQSIDLLLTDVVMPTMLGRELAARAHALRPDLPVLYMSGYAHDMLNTQGTLDADVELLEKPFTEHQLLTTVRSALTGPDRPRPSSPARPAGC